MAKVTPQEFAEKWARRTQGATQDYIRGIDPVTEAPGVKAAEKAEKLLAELTRVINDGTWQERVSGVSLSSWKASAKDKGAGRISAGVQGAQQDVQRFATELLQAVDSASAEVNAMPDLTLEDRIQKSVAFQRRMAEFKRSK